MCIERYVRLVAGSFVLLSLLLAHALTPWWYLLAAFVGVNLLQASLTRWCLLESILRKLRVPECGAAALGRGMTLRGDS